MVSRISLSNSASDLVLQVQWNHVPTAEEPNFRHFVSFHKATKKKACSFLTFTKQTNGKKQFHLVYTQPCASWRVWLYHGVVLIPLIVASETSQHLKLNLPACLLHTKTLCSVPSTTFCFVQSQWSRQPNTLCLIVKKPDLLQRDVLLIFTAKVPGESLQRKLCHRN